MKARDIIGRKIVAVHQSRARRTSGNDGAAWAIDRIVLDDGSFLTFGTLEDIDGGDYSVEMARHIPTPAAETPS